MGDSGELTIVGRNEDDKVVVEVSDTGVGIPPENLAASSRSFDEGNWTRNRSRTGRMLWYLNGAWRHS